MQAVAQGRHIRRHLDLDSHDWLAVERAAVDELRRRHAQRSRAFRIGRAHVEVRALSVVAHQERAAVLQAAGYVHDRDARAVRPVRGPVGRLQNEAAHGVHLYAQARIVPPLLTSSAL